jgi:hypothetical protein
LKKYHLSMARAIRPKTRTAFFKPISVNSKD